METCCYRHTRYGFHKHEYDTTITQDWLSVKYVNLSFFVCSTFQPYVLFSVSWLLKCVRDVTLLYTTTVSVRRKPPSDQKNTSEHYNFQEKELEIHFTSTPKFLSHFFINTSKCVFIAIEFCCAYTHNQSIFKCKPVQIGLN